MEVNAVVTNSSKMDEFSSSTQISTYLRAPVEQCSRELGGPEWFIIVLYSLVLVLDVFGNGIVCYLIISDKRMRTGTNMFLLNMALADIAKAVFCIPSTMLTNLIYKFWPFGHFMCPFMNFTQVAVVCASAFIMVAMSIDRYMAITNPLRQKLSSRGLYLSLAIVWLLALAVPTPIAFTARLRPAGNNTTDNCSRLLCMEVWNDLSSQQYYSHVILFVQYFVPLTVLAFTYIKIGVIIWIKRPPGEANRSRDERMASSKRKVLGTLLKPLTSYYLIDQH